MMMTTDKITTLNNRLKEVKAKFDALKNSGMDEEILITWIKEKTHLSKKEVKLMLNAQEDFYHRLIKKEIVKKLEDDERT